MLLLSDPAHAAAHISIATLTVLATIKLPAFRSNSIPSSQDNVAGSLWSAERASQATALS
jgi:hypothetical protein